MKNKKFFIFISAYLCLLIFYIYLVREKNIFIISTLTIGACIIILFFAVKRTKTRIPLFIALSHFLVVTSCTFFASLLCLVVYENFIVKTLLGLILTLTVSFILSIVINLIVHILMVKFIFKEDYLDRDLVSSFTNIANFSTFLMTVILLFNSTISSNINNINIQNFDTRLNNLETQINANSESHQLSATSSLKKNKNNNDNTENDLDFALMLITMVVYSFASYYALIPFVKRKNKQLYSTDIKIPINIIEIAEIHSILDMKHKHINSYKKNDEN
ncbi:hypothetical protein ACIQXF_07130 [Lysinibacillus sp. NPDC097231]|uniref:hypothetical protein n=1 Tax=Lysinibacillus sp. NPDC097231 TaxID=3364142 RepID=UPI0038251AAA